jgi:hypothetical protein
MAKNKLMKIKRCILLFLCVFCSSKVFTYQITLLLKNPFSLNPIIGLNGNEGDSDSRFIQRMIFSPLIVPMADPTLDSHFNYDISVSMLTQILVFDLESKNFIESNFDISRNIYSRRFRVKLREDMYFRYGEGKEKYDKVTAEDVVFSYRLAQTSLNFFKNNNFSNIFLHAQLSDLENIRWIDPQTVEVTLKSKKNVDQFMRFLCLTPILSVLQLRGSKIEERREYSFNKNMLSNEMSDYNLWTYKSLNDFEKMPASYGQFYVQTVATEELSKGTIPMMYRNVILRKNTYWMPPVEKKSKILTELNLGKHDEYQNDRDEIHIQKENSKYSIKELIDKPNTFFIDYPLTLSDYMYDKSVFESDNVYKKFSVLKRNDSLKMYSFLYSSDSVPLKNTQIRTFFKNCLNRNVFIESLKMNTSIMGKQSIAFNRLFLIIKNQYQCIILFIQFNNKSNGNTLALL